MQDVLGSHRPGDRIRIDFRRRTCETASGTVRLTEAPSLEALRLEDAGRTPTAEQKAFRDAWLGSRVR